MSYADYYPATLNRVLSSQDLASGWSATNTGSSNPTITADYGTSPTCAEAGNLPDCGLTTADRIQVPALSDGQLSIITQGSACPSGAHSAGVWVKGTAASGSLDMLAGDLCTSCPYTTSWSRCTANGGAASTTFALGNISTVGSGTCQGAKSALDVQVWQMDCQNRSTISPSIGPTGAASLSRPPGHVYAATRKLAGMGDSITYASGSGLFPTPIRVANALGPQYAWIQGGVPGDTCAQVLARWPAVLAQLSAGDLMFLMCGVNDIRTGVSAATAYTSWAAIMDSAKAAGLRMRPVLTLNFEGASDYDAAKGIALNDLRTLEQAWCTANGVECSDPAAELQTGNEIKAPYQQGDGIHLSGAGQVVFAQYIAKGAWVWQ